MRVLPHVLHGTRCRLQEPHSGWPSAVRVHTARLCPQRAQRGMAHPARAVLAARRAGGGQVAGLLPAAERAGGQRRPVAAAAPARLPSSRRTVRAVRPQLLHCPWLAGSRRKHPLQTGSPAAVRLATSAALPAAAAGLEPVPVIAAAAAARFAEPVAQRDRLPARRAGRGHDPGDAGVQQRLDEHVDARRAVRSLAGEQRRALVQFPQHLVALERAGYRARDHVLQPGRVRARAEAADMGRDRRDGIGTVVGTAAGAARPAVLVTGGDLPGGPADRARLGGPAPAAVARGADPQAAIALHQPPGLAAMSAPGQDQPPGPGSLQVPDQQLDLRRALRAARR